MIYQVGKYAYAIGNLSDGAVTPIILDVALDVRTKVCLLPLSKQSTFCNRGDHWLACTTGSEAEAVLQIRC